MRRVPGPMGAMPDSYGSDFTFVFFFGPSNSPRPIAIAAISVATMIMMAIAMYSSSMDYLREVRLNCSVVANLRADRLSCQTLPAGAPPEGFSEFRDAEDGRLSGVLWPGKYGWCRSPRL